MQWFSKLFHFWLFNSVKDCVISIQKLLCWLMRITLQHVGVRYSQMLLPVSVDKIAIRNCWKDNMWCNCMAGKGLEYLSRDSSSTKWLVHPLSNGRDYVDVV